MTLPHPSCPDCGAPLPGDSPQALCPACLLRQALASRTIVEGQESTPPPPPPAPEEIADKFPQFEVTECLGSGGMGVVYKARQKSLDRWVAIKILRPEKTGDERFAERFAREAQTLARLNHPNIVTVFDYGETSGLYYIVMEFVDGVNLRDLLREGKLEPEQALAIVPPICEALQYAHEKGIVHRDIKPENLLLDRDGRIKIADFGIASLVGAGGEASGTPPYMAPEQQGPSTVDHRADIYALGVVLYEMLTGERPAKDLVAPSRKVPVDVRLDEMVMRALDQNPDRRYQTAEEFRTVVETAGAPAPSVPPPVVPAPPPPMPTTAPAKRGAFARLWWLFLVMLPVGVLLGLGVGSLLLSLVPKKYEAKAVVQIRQEPVVLGSPTSPPTWIQAIKSTRTLADVATKMDLSNRWNATHDQVSTTLNSIITVDEIRGTSLFEIRVRFTDRKDAVDIANTLAGAFRERARITTGSDLVIIHEQAIEPTAPISPNAKLTLLASAGIGLAVSLIVALMLILTLGRSGARGCLILGLLILFGVVTAAGIWFATTKRTIPPPQSASASAAKTPPVRLMATLRIIDMPRERNFPAFKEAMEPDMRVIALLRTVVETDSEAELPIPFIPGRDISGGILPREGSLMIQPRMKDGIVTYHLEGIEKSDGSITKRTDLGTFQFPLGNQGFLDNWSTAFGRKQVALMSFETTESAPGRQPVALGGYKYGPVIERVVSDWNLSPTNCLIDLDTGKLFSIASDSGLVRLPQQDPDWKTSIEKEIRPTSDGTVVTDAFGLVNGDGHKRKPGLVGTNLLTAPYTWRSKDAALLMDAFNPKELDEKRNETRLTAIPSGYLDHQDDIAWAFCTSEGRRGLLQFTGYNDDPRGVNIRYKLVEEPSVGWDGSTGLQVRTFSVHEEALLPAGLAPNGDYEVRIKGYPDDLPFNYSILVYYTKDKMEPIYTLPEAGGYLRYSAAKDECPVYWHRSGEFVIITDRGTQRSKEIYLLAVSGEKAERVALPDFVANALGRIDATRTYRGSLITPQRWEGDDLHLDLGLDTLKGYFTCQVVLELQHGPNTVPRIILKSCTTPLPEEK